MSSQDVSPPRYSAHLSAGKAVGVRSGQFNWLRVWMESVMKQSHEEVWGASFLTVSLGRCKTALVPAFR